MKRAKAIAVPHPFPYGANELKEFSKKFTIKAFGFALTIIAAISILLALLMSFVKENRIDIPKITGGYDLIELVNTNKEVNIQQYNNTRVPTSFGFRSIAGNPVPVPISELTKQPGAFADFGDLGKVLSIEGTNEVSKDNVGPVLGNTNSKLNYIELSPEDFVAVEEEPYIDLSELQRKVVYPELARRIGAEGKVIVRVLIGKDGTPLKSIIEFSDNEVLNDAAVKAVMGSVFTPALNNKQPVTVWVSIPINFRLR